MEKTIKQVAQIAEVIKIHEGYEGTAIPLLESLIQSHGWGDVLYALAAIAGGQSAEKDYSHALAHLDEDLQRALSDFQTRSSLPPLDTVKVRVLDAVV